MRVPFLFLALALLMPLSSCKSQTVKQPAQAVTTEKVEAYYFHFNARCVTCKTVEAEAKADIELLYPSQVKSGKVSFTAVNLDEPSGKGIAEKLGVNGQTLLLVKGVHKVNITNEGFMYARTDPEKFKAVIKEKVDELLKL